MASVFGFLNPVFHHPEEAAAIRSAVADMLDGRATLGKIAADWNSRGLRRRRDSSSPWAAQHVYQVLRGDRIGGIVRRDGKVVDEAPTWLPIITRQQHDGLQVVLRDRDLRSKFSYNRVHLARGIARCGVCGRDLHHMGSGVRARYVCQSRSTYFKSSESDGLRHPQIADHLLHEVMRDSVLALLVSNGTNLVSYLPRPISVVTKALGQAHDVVAQMNESDGDDRALHLREAEHAVALLEGEREDRALWQALAGLDDTSPDTLAASWDAARLEDQWMILHWTLAVTVDPGYGPSRVRVESLLT